MSERHPYDAFDPGRDAAVWETLARWRDEGRRFARISVVETRGFTPRKAGAHMLLDAAGETCGTIGGGAIEHEAVAHARTLLEQGATSVLVHRHLTKELGMCCGGEMTVHVEAIVPAPRLVIFGAGFISKPLAALAVGCGFRVEVVDERPEWATPARFPGVTVHCRAPEEAARALGFEIHDYAVVTTHDHALDQRIVQRLLKTPMRFVGMVGSLPKQRKFALRLRARGYADADIARLHAPLGLAIGAATPEEIAVSVMAQLIAVRRGRPVEPGWVPPPGAGVAEDESEGEDSESVPSQTARVDEEPLQAARPGAPTGEDAR